MGAFPAFKYRKDSEGLNIMRLIIGSSYNVSFHCNFVCVFIELVCWEIDYFHFW